MIEENKIPARQDIETLAREMRDLKDSLREISGKLGRMERHLRVFFPASFPKAKAEPRKRERLEDSPPTMTSEQILSVYNELVDLARTDRGVQVEERLSRLGLGDLTLLVRELGVPTGKNPTRSALGKSVMGRLKQSIMLSRHTARPSSTDTTHSREHQTSEIEQQSATTDLNDPDSKSSS